ncbi:MAG: Rrf2 family transcriptional regulator [Bryobacteraceae bacterium]|jgi:Rrf2 family protein
MLNTLSKKCKYALRAMYRLTREYDKGPVLIARVSEQERIPRKFLEAILLQLKRAGLVDSRKGRRGGYFLAIPPSRITLGAIIRTMDGPLAPLPCARETAGQPCAECSDKPICETRMVMREVRDAIAGILDHTTLAGVCSRAPEEAETVLNYEI